MDQTLYDSLEKAITNRRTDVVRSLLFAYEQNNQDQDSSFPLYVLNTDIPPNGTLLHLAVKLDEVDVVRTLLSVGANPSVQNEEGDTPLDLAQSTRMTTVFNEDLLKAAGQSDIKRIISLLEAGVNVNVHDSSSSQNTALHWASSYGSELTVICLLEHGADVNSLNSQGMTPLHDAVHRKAEKIVEILMEAGANALIKATNGKYEGQSAFTLAQDEPTIRTILYKYCKNEIGMFNGKGDSNELHRGSLESLATETDLALSVSQLSLLSNDTPPPKIFPVLDSGSHTSDNLDPGVQLLWPKPQILNMDPGEAFVLSSGELQMQISSSIYPPDLRPQILRIFEFFSTQFESLGIKLCYECEPLAQGKNEGACVVNSHYFSRRECYKLMVTSAKINLLASDLPGLYYGLSTLCQLFKLAVVKYSLPLFHIEDWPSISHRGILIDFTLDSRIPNMTTLKSQIEILSLLKINQIHLLFLIQPEIPWPCQYTKKELMELEMFCNERFIFIVPTFNILPGEDFSPQMLASISSVLNSFPLSKCLQLGSELSNSEMVQFFSKYIVITSKAIDDYMGLLIMDLAQQNDDEFMSACNQMGFDGHALILLTSTLNGNSLAGCPEQSTANLFRVAQVARILRTCGFVVANWCGSLPHHSPLCFSWSPILVAAGLSWNLNTPWDLVHEKQANLLNHHIVKDSEERMGKLIVDLGNVERLVGPGSILYRLIECPDLVDMDQFTTGSLQRAIQQIKECQLKLDICKPQCAQSNDIIAELSFTINFMLFACRIGRLLRLNGMKPGYVSGIPVINVGISNLPHTSRTDLANKLLSITEEYRTVWQSRYLCSGLQHSFRRFSLLLKAFVPDDQTSLPPLF